MKNIVKQFIKTRYPEYLYTYFIVWDPEEWEVFDRDVVDIVWKLWWTWFISVYDILHVIDNKISRKTLDLYNNYTDELHDAASKYNVEDLTDTCELPDFCDRNPE
jgi:hypothetical protein